MTISELIVQLATVIHEKGDLVVSIGGVDAKGLRVDAKWVSVETDGLGKPFVVIE